MLLHTDAVLLGARCSMLNVRTATLERNSTSYQSCSTHTRNFPKGCDSMMNHSLSLIASHLMSCLVVDLDARSGGSLRSGSIQMFFDEAYPNIAKTIPQQQAAGMGMGMGRGRAQACAGGRGKSRRRCKFLYLFPSGLQSCTSLPQKRRWERATPYRVSSPSACARVSPPSNSARAILGRYQVCMTHPASNLGLHRLNVGRAWALSWLLQPRKITGPSNGTQSASG